MKPLFMTGMFRSGTTTMARALNVHSGIAFASDPFNEVFKALRSEEAYKISQPTPVMAPLQDYYFDPEGQELLQRILWDIDLDTPLTVWSKAQLLERLRPRCETYSQALAPLLGSLEGGTYREILENLLGRVRAAYGKPETEVIGFKEVWSTEFIPAIARTWPETRFITVVRDPRAVCASKNVRDERYPWHFMARQWRKLAALDYLFGVLPELKDRVLQIRYEDFISAPEEVTQSICEFLDISWDPAMADPSAYKDGAGNPWYQNTSYGKADSGFDISALQRWRDVLKEKETRLIELMCGPEMALHGYEKETLQDGEADAELLLNPPTISEEEKAKWMRGVVPNDQVTASVEICQEKIRSVLLSQNVNGRQMVSANIVRASFLDRVVLNSL